jgi:hypothetical protein
MPNETLSADKLAGRARPLYYPMGSIALGAAFAAVQLVHQAYSKVKTSKARCARLVERCQFIVDRLERIVTTTRAGDAVIIRERIRELERWVFKHFLRWPDRNNGLFLLEPLRIPRRP